MELSFIFFCMEQGEKQSLRTLKSYIESIATEREET